MPTESFASNRLQEIDDGNYDEISNDPKSPAVITLDRCNVTPWAFFYIHQKTKVLKNLLTVFFDTEAWYIFVKA